MSTNSMVKKLYTWVVLNAFMFCIAWRFSLDLELMLYVFWSITSTKEVCAIILNLDWWKNVK